ncbi:MAG: GNAT family N-acetyltransferase [Cohaesibacter sp.]|nr:GNAT family N-acetyltransferase [Cohaesibacter sp.]
MHWLSRWCAQKGWGSVLPIRTHERACLSLDRGQPHGGLNLRAKKRKEYQRQLRRLGDIGPVSSCSTAEGSDCQSGLEESLEHFFALEAAGWKGQRGTALVSNPDTKAFVEAFLPDMVADGSARIDWIKVGDQPVASLISLKAGAGLFTWKIGYDPTFARFSPGVQIMLDLSKQALKDPDLTFIDSLATQGHPMVDHIWPHRRAMASLLVPLGLKGARQARQAALYYRSYDQLRASAKQLLRR